MRINKLKIQNFRGFEDFTCELTDPCLIVGNNGSGKTSLIEALAIAAGSLFLGFSDIRGNQRHGIQQDDVRQVIHKSGKKPKRQYPVVISCQGVVNEQEIKWTRTLNKERGRTTWAQAKEIKTIAEQFQQGIRKGEKVILPIVAYYSAKRSWSKANLNQVETDKPGARSKGYFNWFNPPANTTKLWNWMRWMEGIARQEGEPFDIFTEFKKAIVESLPEIEEAIYERQDNQLLLKIENEKINFWSLDEQKRNFLGMVADIAYRCVVLNPQLGKQAIEQTPGVVLIDNLELHLDPELEKTIMNKLRHIFPMIQFIGTTQSSLITEGLDPQQIVNLSL
jgi:predicted ATP-binding protein involved in virulence